MNEKTNEKLKDINKIPGINEINTTGETTDGKKTAGQKTVGLWIQMKKCPLFVLLCVSGLMFTLLGMAGRNSVYKDYPLNRWTTPYLSLVMRGLEDGVRPFGTPVYREALVSLEHLLTWRGERAKEGDAIIIPMLEGEQGMGGENAGNGGSRHEGGSFPGENGVLITDGEPGYTDMEQSAAVSENGSTGSRVTENGSTGSGVSENHAEENSVTGNHVSGNGTAGSDRPGNEVAGNGVSGNGETYLFTTVTEDYFNDAVFIGDSRTQGLYEYGGLQERADFYSKISLTIYDVLTEPFIKDEETGRKITVEEALTKKTYGKIYLMLGINELGTGTTETFMEEYRRVVARLRELQPDAVLFVQAIMRVTGVRDEEDPIFNNTNINDKNTEIAKLADGHSIFYLDVNEVVCDGEGNLNADYTADEVHLKAQYYLVWKEFLLEHGIERGR